MLIQLPDQLIHITRMHPARLLQRLSRRHMTGYTVHSHLIKAFLCGRICLKHRPINEYFVTTIIVSPFTDMPQKYMQLPPARSDKYRIGKQPVYLTIPYSYGHDREAVSACFLKY